MEIYIYEDENLLCLIVGMFVCMYGAGRFEGERGWGQVANIFN